MGFIFLNRVLIIIVDNCELLDKIIYNLLEVVVNIYDWVIVIKFDYRISRIIKWIKDKRKDIWYWIFWLLLFFLNIYIYGVFICIVICYNNYSVWCIMW